MYCPLSRRATLPSTSDSRGHEIGGRRRDRLELSDADPSPGPTEQVEGFVALAEIRPDELRTRLIDPVESQGG